MRERMTKGAFFLAAAFAVAFSITLMTAENADAKAAWCYDGTWDGGHMACHGCPADCSHCEVSP